MARAISADLLGDLLKQSSEEGLLPLLNIAWNDGENFGSMRLVVHDENVTSTASGASLVYTAADFAVQLPDEDDIDVPMLQIGVQDIDLSVRTELRKLDSRFPATATLYLVLLTDPNSVQQTFSGTIRSIRLSLHALVASIELYADMSREPVTTYKMSPAYGFNAIRGR